MVHRFTLTQASTDLNGQRHRLIQTSRHRKSHHDILKGFRDTLSENSCKRTFIPLTRSGEIVMTQTPGYISAFPGETVTVSCRSSSSTYYSGISKYEVNWYQIKEGQPKLLLYFATTRQTGIPDRFSGTGSGNDFTLKIKGVTEDDAADYYCQNDYGHPLTQ
ncbi:unnamed protein product [Ranitomeya imitator]|uniref:Ig-like domain-containing protein n=1 Tax=Ranitomeya imitator TaxID=111125 RepID=A0ABN9LZ97_9NEOB|nr:unnamed protein product [Ranitomeya imitator]